MQKPTQKLFIVLLGNLPDVLTASISMKDKKECGYNVAFAVGYKEKRSTN